VDGEVEVAEEGQMANGNEADDEKKKQASAWVEGSQAQGTHILSVSGCCIDAMI
jgi:hypothetical protein